MGCVNGCGIARNKGEAMGMALGAALVVAYQRVAEEVPTGVAMGLEGWGDSGGCQEVWQRV